jgi:hypothetical protein
MAKRTGISRITFDRIIADRTHSERIAGLAEGSGVSRQPEFRKLEIKTGRKPHESAASSQYGAINRVAAELQRFVRTKAVRTIPDSGLYSPQIEQIARRMGNSRSGPMESV